MKTSGDEALLIMERDIGGNECRLQEYAPVFSDIASKKFNGRELTFDGLVRITATDVSAWKAHLPDAA
ncbi:hypothetical protein [Ensifer sp. BR816]|uniref:hypothetical protein n=1 Tax=Rhizobium sp. (strain BR816) TaxID=1057002 RepID=UPI000362739E|nr:hypothetical protein [Ensifer sp. BR816]